ncbi:MAG: glycoside hydrolase family 2 TIM barrel-domain containing protein [Acutalibacter sp.]|jgi:beta-galactosidase
MRTTTQLDRGWKFHLGEIQPEEPVWGFLKSGTHNQSGAARALEDSQWETVCLPHDFVIEGPATPPTPRTKPRTQATVDYLGDLHVLHGSRAGNVAWYRKWIGSQPDGQRVYLKFDGVYRDSTLYVNEFRVGHHLSGYTEAIYDITDFLREDGDNLIAMRVDARTAEGWYYEGGGIYRHVWLITTPEIAVDVHGVFVKSQVDLATGQAELTVETRVVNRSGNPADTAVSHCITGPDGREFPIPSCSLHLPGWGENTVEQRITIPAAQLWDVDSPQLYTIRSFLDDQEDSAEQFGIREIRFDPDQGFFLNGRHLKLKGVCCHQDHGGLGVAIPDGIWQYRIRKLKEMGCNAYRCAHHPASPELLQACDSLGMLVMEENRLLSSSQEDLSQLRQMVLAGRNHPSIFLWSLGNEEVHVQFTPQGRKIAATMAKVVRQLDDTRPVTAAVCMWEAGKCGQTVTDLEKQSMLAPSVDVFGFNYFPNIWDKFHQAHPQLPLIVTEDSSFCETRGCRKTQQDLCHLCAMDPGQGNYRAGETAWKNTAQRDYLAGTFVWTGFDYYGETAPYGWPAVSSQFGIMDLCGFPKDTYYYYKSCWSGENVLHLCPGEGGLWCFTNCDTVELWSGETSLGTQSPEKDSLLVWEGISPTQPLTAIGYRDGKEILRVQRTPWGPAAQIQGAVDGSYLEQDGTKTVVVNLQLVDGGGNFVEDGCLPVSLTVSPEVELLGWANGDPSCHANTKGPGFSTFNGRMQVILRVIGSGTLHADVSGLSGTAISV